MSWINNLIRISEKDFEEIECDSETELNEPELVEMFSLENVWKEIVRQGFGPTHSEFWDDFTPQIFLLDNTDECLKREVLESKLDCFSDLLKEDYLYDDLLLTAYFNLSRYLYNINYQYKRAFFERKSTIEFTENDLDTYWEKRCLSNEQWNNCLPEYNEKYDENKPPYIAFDINDLMAATITSRWEKECCYFVPTWGYDFRKQLIMNYKSLPWGVRKDASLTTKYNHNISEKIFNNLKNINSLDWYLFECSHGYVLSTLLSSVQNSDAVLFYEVAPMKHILYSISESPLALGRVKYFNKLINILKKVHTTSPVVDFHDAMAGTMYQMTHLEISFSFACDCFCYLSKDWDTCVYGLLLYTYFHFRKEGNSKIMAWDNTLNLLKFEIKSRLDSMDFFRKHQECKKWKTGFSKIYSEVYCKCSVEEHYPVQIY